MTSVDQPEPAAPAEPAAVPDGSSELEVALAAARKAQADANAAVERAEAAANAARAKAQADAAQAKAQADAAQADAAQADAASASSPHAGARSAPLDADRVEVVRSGYAFDGPALEMGALVNGEALPDVPIRIPLAMTNRHGLIAGATGTGKTRTLQVLAEQFSAHGVPVFAADIKGDLSGVAIDEASSEKLLARTAGIGQDWRSASFPTAYFSLGGRGTGVPIRATVAGFGPLLLSKVLGLNDTQESSLGLVFHYADQAGLPLLDLTDLRAVLTHLVSAEGKAELRELGGLSSSTAGVILRELITFADQGADVFFGEPEIDTAEFLTCLPDGRGVISLLEVPGVQSQPALYSTFLMWLLADLFNDLPEVGDLDKPKLVFFFDEAHLLFAGASKDFLTQITQTVRLIRSKGVGIFFVTQTPKDLPGDVLAQLGSRVQHQLRAFTPDDAKALRSSVSTFPNSGYDLEEVLTTLGTGEAIVTVMNEKGAPSPVAWTRLRAPQASMAPAPDSVIEAAVAASPLLAKYGAALDRESAREILAAKLEAAHSADLRAQEDEDRADAAAELAKQQKAAAAQQATEQKKAQDAYDRVMRETRPRSSSRTSSRTSTRSRAEKTPLEQILGSSVTKTILTGVVTGIFGTRRRR